VKFTNPRRRGCPRRAKIRGIAALVTSLRSAAACGGIGARPSSRRGLRREE